MRPSLLVAWLTIVGCKGSSPPSPSPTPTPSAPVPSSTPTTDSTPSTAARCQVEAVKARDAAKWTACFHPDYRPTITPAIEKKTAEPGFWEKAATGSAQLEKITDTDFRIYEVSNVKHARLNDPKADFEVVLHSDGRWYVVDTGI